MNVSLPALAQGSAAKASPVLSSEIVCRILREVKDESEENIGWYLQNFLDLFACSLVCTVWHKAARSLLVPDEAFQQILWMGVDGGFNSIVRVAELLSESRRLGLHYCDLLTELRIPVDELTNEESETDCDELMEAYKTILSIAQNVRMLNIQFEHYHPYLYSSEDMEQLYGFFDAIAPLCSTITGFRLCIHDGDSDDNVPFIPYFVKAIASYIEFLELDWQNLEDQMQEALSLCNNLREVRIRSTPSRLLISLIPCWPRLERFYRRFQPPEPEYTGRLVIELADSCPHLEEFVFESDFCVVNDLTCQAVCHLLKQNHGIKHIAVGNDSFDNTFMHQLIQNQPNLEILNLASCTKIHFGTSFSWPQGSPWWPKLRRLLLGMCFNLEPAFIKEVVGKCPKLEVVTLPTSLQDSRDFEGFMTRLGFKYSNGENVFGDFSMSQITFAWRRTVAVDAAS
ncbi:hypothetical protein BC937DRAFT_88748 [Endogone sp. FLAS-F59071]|nr:hypothetical protein BC937DRAFT_88748 [Endogone sp. FLAS-F59071]|eukprot:RUS22488.1 hypothetical protein BC937DRAFT_88748 [Endogone sp. FLAS-F59071]